MRIDLLRHGETTGGACYRGSLDDPLTVVGWRQMEAGIAGTGGWGRIVTSPLSRCARFAEGVAARLSLPLAVDDRLREIHFGEWEGRTADQIATFDADRLARFWGDPVRNPPPGGEPLADFVARVDEAWRDLLRYGGATLVVCHGGTIRVVRTAAEGLTLAEGLRLDVPHGSLHVIERESPCVRS